MSRACPLFLLAWFGFAVPALAETPAPYDVLCDARVEVYSCHPQHPGGARLDFDELRAKLNGLGATSLSVTLMSGETLTSRRFKIMDNAFLVGGDTVRPKDVRRLAARTPWRKWKTVGQLAFGGAMLFGGAGLAIDALQWLGGGRGDLGAAGVGVLTGAVLFGGLGVLAAPDMYGVMIQEGLEQRTVGSPPPLPLAAGF